MALSSGAWQREVSNIYFQVSTSASLKARSKILRDRRTGDTGLSVVNLIMLPTESDGEWLTHG
jgi:hypothetical protein